MADRLTSIDGADELVRLATAHIGDFIIRAAEISAGDGAVFLAQWAEAELRGISKRVYGVDGELPVPEIRRWELDRLRSRFPAEFPAQRPVAD